MWQGFSKLGVFKKGVARTSQTDAGCRLHKSGCRNPMRWIVVQMHMVKSGWQGAVQFNCRPRQSDG